MKHLEASPLETSSPAKTPQGLASLHLPVEGMTCASCAARLEKQLGQLEGVEQVSVNLALEKVAIVYDATKITPKSLVATIEETGFSVPTRTIRLAIEGMTCASCAARIEKQMLARPDVFEARINLALERGEFTVPAGLPAAELVNTVRATGFEAQLFRSDLARRSEQEARHRQRQQREQQTDRTDLIIAAVLTAPLLVQMILMLMGIPPGIPPLLELALATPVQFYAGRRFYKGAYAALRSGGANMDVLVALGTSAAYFFSLVMILRLGDGAREHLYFEAAAVIITLVLLGKIMETRAKRNTASAILELMNLRPQTANIIRKGEEKNVPIEDVVEGDLVIVRPGESIAVDGIIEEGHSQADESLITGESLPVSKQPGDHVTGGALNGTGRLLVRTSRVGADTTLGRIIRLVENAQSGKAPVQKLVDRVSAVFVPIVLVIALLTFLGWWLSGAGFETALVSMVAVLVIACPCALGLATPTAIVAGTGAAARSGILFRNVEALESAHRIDTVIFDKTGTLTRGRPAITLSYALNGNEDEMLQLAASLQAASEHPLARAVLERAEEKGLSLHPVTDFSSHTGAGVEGSVDGHKLLIGNTSLMTRRGMEIPQNLGELQHEREKLGQTVVFVARDNALLGLLAIADPLRPQSPQAIALLKQRGIHVVMLSGDATRTAAAMAGLAGIDDFHGQTRPEDKAKAIEKLQKQGHRVAMVGDGVNDAPALALADLGIAMGSGSDVAMETAGVTLMRPDPRLVDASLQASRQTWRKLKQNLFWAFIYNLVGIPLAVSGLLNPALAGAAMAMSSISVVSNSLLLRGWKAEFDSFARPHKY